MKKILSITLLSLFCCNIVLSETLTYNCKKIIGYVDEDWNHNSHYSDITATLIVDKKTQFDKWGTLFNGFATLVYENKKREFIINSFTALGFDAYNYSKIDDEDVKKHKSLKKYKGKISGLSFLELRSQSINREYYDLYYIPVGGLWSLETNINHVNLGAVGKFVCKQN